MQEFHNELGIKDIYYTITKIRYHQLDPTQNRGSKYINSVAMTEALM